MGYYGNPLRKEKEDNLICLFININGLQVEEWKAKNDIVRDFCIQSKADIISL